jgi:hypothetical protein
MAPILSDQQRVFLEANSAVMATVAGQPDRARQGLLGRVADRQRAGPDPARTRLYRAATGRDPDDLEEYRAAMVAERRLVDALTPERVYPSPR